MIPHRRTQTLLPLFVAIALACLMLIPELHAHKTLIAVLLLLCASGLWLRLRTIQKTGN